MGSMLLTPTLMLPSTRTSLNMTSTDEHQELLSLMHAVKCSHKDTICIYQYSDRL